MRASVGRALAQRNKSIFDQPVNTCFNHSSKKHREELRSGSVANAAHGKHHGHNSMEELWREFFSDPSQWWDHTMDKVNPSHPDFKHKITGVGLWLDRRANPSWIKTELASIKPGSISRSLFSWNAMLKSCRGKDVLDLYNQMQAEAVKPNTFIFVTVLKSCASVGALNEGRRVQAQVIESGFESNVFVGNTLVDMYAKCGSIEDAERVFHGMPTRDVISWNTMLAGYVNCEEGQKALELFQQMHRQAVTPNPISFVLVLKACAMTMDLDEGRWVHKLIIEMGCESDVFVGNSLVTMYAKCGSIADAESVFLRMPTRDVVSWNSMLGGLAMHGLGKEAVELFQGSYQGGVNMDEVTFTCLLSACSHGGFVKEGILFFESMDSVYGVSPTVQHYACMVDLLGRAGCLEQAEKFLKTEPKIRRNSVALTTLLGACRNYGNIEMGQRIAQQVLELEPDNPAAYMLLSNLLASGIKGIQLKKRGTVGTEKAAWEHLD